MNAIKDDSSRMGAFDKVKAYLTQHLRVGEKTDNFRLPPIREISKRAGVSPSSVRNVLVNLAEQGHVEIFAGSGAFWIPETQRRRNELVIGINTGQKKVFNHWDAKLYGCMVQSAVEAGIEIKFKPFIYEPAYHERLDFSRLKESIRGIDGCFLSFPFAGTREVVEFLEEQEIPCFFYNPLSLTTTSNFLSPDYFGAARQIGRVWSRTGRRCVLLIQAPGMLKSTSCQLIYSGLTAGFGIEGNMLPEIHKINVLENQRPFGHQAFREFVERQGKVPDAVHCTADDLALGVLDAARELGIEVPSAMSVIGGNGRNRHDSEGGASSLLTATAHPIEKIGENFVHLFRKRSANQMRDVPGMYFPMRMLIGQTTRPEENDLLTTDLAEKN